MPLLYLLRPLHPTSLCSIPLSPYALLYLLPQSQLPSVYAAMLSAYAVPGTGKGMVVLGREEEGSVMRIDLSLFLLLVQQAPY